LRGFGWIQVGVGRERVLCVCGCVLAKEGEGGCPYGKLRSPLAGMGSSSDEEDDVGATARPDEKKSKAASVSLFEFGSAKNSAVVDTTLAGYCPVGDNLDGCEWRPLKNNQPSAPQFRIVF